MQTMKKCLDFWLFTKNIVSINRSCLHLNTVITNEDTNTVRLHLFLIFSDGFVPYIHSPEWILDSCTQSQSTQILHRGFLRRKGRHMAWNFVSSWAATTVFSCRTKFWQLGHWTLKGCWQADFLRCLASPLPSPTESCYTSRDPLKQSYGPAEPPDMVPVKENI